MRNGRHRVVSGYGSRSLGTRITRPRSLTSVAREFMPGSAVVVASWSINSAIKGLLDPRHPSHRRPRRIILHAGRANEREDRAQYGESSGPLRYEADRENPDDL